MAFCTNCGKEINEEVKECPECGFVQKNLEEDKVEETPVEEENTETTEETKTEEEATGVQEEAKVEEEKVESVTPTSNVSSNSKSKIAAGLLGIFLGSFGAHNFYLGYTRNAVIQLCLTLIGWVVCGLGPMIAGVWGLVEGIIFLLVIYQLMLKVIH